MSWTSEKVEKLKELWTKGHTASQIAEALGDTTRNAVIGKVHRLGLSNRETNISKSPTDSQKITKSTKRGRPPKLNKEPKKRGRPLKVRGATSYSDKKSKVEKSVIKLACVFQYKIPRPIYAIYSLLLGTLKTAA